MFTYEISYKLYPFFQDSGHLYHWCLRCCAIRHHLRARPDVYGLHNYSFRE